MRTILSALWFTLAASVWILFFTLGVGMGPLLEAFKEGVEWATEDRPQGRRWGL
jgi:cytochrome bd-type quinol oxidase subunit 1